MSLSPTAPVVQTISPETTLAEAARVMIRDSLGSLLISEKTDRAVVGICTDRDIVREIGKGCDPGTTTVAVFLDRPVTTLPEGASRREVTKEMRMHGIRRIPLVDETGRVTRVVSLDDLLVECGEEAFDMARAIRKEFDNEAPDPEPME